VTLRSEMLNRLIVDENIGIVFGILFDTCKKSNPFRSEIFDNVGLFHVSVVVLFF